MKGPEILVTGATGFLGRALLARLRAEDRHVRVLARRVPAWLLGSEVDVRVGDLGDSAAVHAALDGATVVYHLGATQRGTAAEFERGTVRGTMNIIDACVRERVRRL